MTAVAPATRTALETAQEFVRAIEAKDLDAVEATLSHDARQLFMHSAHTIAEAGVADLIADRASGLCVADVDGRDEIMAYTDALFRSLVGRTGRCYRVCRFRKESEHRIVGLPSGTVLDRGARPEPNRPDPIWTTEGQPLFGA
jgi:hypothetical protein